MIFCQLLSKKEESVMKTLRQAKVGDRVRVVKLHGEGAVKAVSWTWV